MAVLDTELDEIVLRVIYDGPPEAGKTTSLRALAASLAQPTVTPAEDPGGRTLWFDWMEYVGGRFEGSRIRCQIVSVPGQRELGRRRKRLLETADVVVFVGDSTPRCWDSSIDYLFELQRLVRPADPAVGVVFQANKRDLPDAIPLDEVRMRLGDLRWSVAVVESIASDGTGIREAFVYAVRLALDRVREQMMRGTLAVGRPELATPEELLAMLAGDDLVVQPRVHVAAPIDGSELFRGVFDDELAPAPIMSPGDGPQPPNTSVPSGAIWPPVEGRTILREVSQLPLTVRKLKTGSWIAGLGCGWRIVTSPEAVYDSIDLGRAALVQWARLHAACVSLMSPRRCIVLAATGDGRWRLWQIVRAEESLRNYVEQAAVDPTPDLALHRLCTTAQMLIEVDTKIARAPCELPCSLDTIGQSDAQGVYIGLMPASAPPRSGIGRPALALLDQELGPMLAREAHERRAQLGRALDRFPRQFLHADAVLTSLSRWLS